VPIYVLGKPTKHWYKTRHSVGHIHIVCL